MKKALKIIGCVIGAILAAIILFVLVIICSEYKPKPVSDININGSNVSSIQKEDIGKKEFKIVTWNIGYGCLQASADFFMDGGKQVETASKQMVKENVKAVEYYLTEEKPDFVFMQEVDKKSKRSHKVNEYALLTSYFTGYQNTFAYNFKVLYLPYPIPPIGMVNSGITTLSKNKIDNAQRVSLPCPFKWPMRVANLKRCVSVNRLPIEGTEKELVLVNVHLEAYDSGEGKIAQTKMLRELLEAETAKGNYVIAGGDFNQSFSNINLAKYPAISDEMWLPGIIDVSDFENFQLKMDDSVPSCRSLDKPYVAADDFQYYVLDGYIVSKNVQVTKFATDNIDFQNSDHNPVVMEFKLK